MLFFVVSLINFSSYFSQLFLCSYDLFRHKNKISMSLIVAASVHIVSTIFDMCGWRGAHIEESRCIENQNEIAWNWINTDTAKYCDEMNTKSDNNGKPHRRKGNKFKVKYKTKAMNTTIHHLTNNSHPCLINVAEKGYERIEKSLNWTTLSSVQHTMDKEYEIGVQ